MLLSVFKTTGDLCFVNRGIRMEYIGVAQQDEALLHLPATPFCLAAKPLQKGRQILRACQLHKLHHQPQLVVRLLLSRIGLREVQ